MLLQGHCRIPQHASSIARNLPDNHFPWTDASPTAIGLAIEPSEATNEVVQACWQQSARRRSQLTLRELRNRSGSNNDSGGRVAATTTVTTTTNGAVLGKMRCLSVKWRCCCLFRKVSNLLRRIRLSERPNLPISTLFFSCHCWWSTDHTFVRPPSGEHYHRARNCWRVCYYSMSEADHHGDRHRRHASCSIQAWTQVN